MLIEVRLAEVVIRMFVDQEVVRDHREARGPWLGKRRTSGQTSATMVSAVRRPKPAIVLKRLSTASKAVTLCNLGSQSLDCLVQKVDVRQDLSHYKAWVR